MAGSPPIDQAATPTTAALGASRETFSAAERDFGRPTVSVCIVNWNCRPWLEACLGSLYQRPQGVSFETIVVDNASTDGAPELVLAKFPQVRLIRNRTNVGFSQANNQAVSLAHGEYLFFLNNDTEVPARALAEFVSFAREHPQVGMLGPTLRGADGALQVNVRQLPTVAALLHRLSLFRWTGWFRGAYQAYRRQGFDPALSRQIHAVPSLMGAAVFLPRAAFERVGRWDERFRFGGEDLDLSLRVRQHYQIVHFGRVEILHYGSVASQANVDFSTPNLWIGYIQFFRGRGVPGWQIRGYQLLLTVDLPLQILGKLLQLAWRTWRGQPGRAAESRRAARGLWHFFTRDLGRFWRA